MKAMINTSQLGRANDGVERVAQDCGPAETTRGAAVHSPSNWAWSVATTQYDWMDNHAPSAAFDWL